jgi:hypothetical protein
MFGFLKRRRDDDGSAGTPGEFAPTVPLHRPAGPQPDPSTAMEVAETGWEDWEQSLQLMERAAAEGDTQRDPRV